MIVIVEVPAGVEEDVVTVNVELPEPLIEAGLNVVVVPAGAPDTERAIVPLKPFHGVVLTSYVVVAPCVTVRECGCV